MDESDHRYPADIQVALRFLDRSGVPRREAAPLLHRMLWRLGVALPPPILAGFLTNTLLQGLLFGVFWTVLMWLLLWQGRAPALEPSGWPSPGRTSRLPPPRQATAVPARGPQAAHLAAVPQQPLRPWRSAP
ncbi:DUF6404 family protein [Stenotrophomonas indicatrix]|nr:DUF6404 family protein [Stenotrophomonas indicatrix]WGV56602.1 DUF6404 family protein [Stenotrophomonas indicatrix]